MATKAVTEAGIKFWILEILAENPSAEWFHIERFFMSEVRKQNLQMKHINQARNIYRNLRSRCPVQTGEAQRRSV